MMTLHSSPHFAKLLKLCQVAWGWSEQQCPDTSSGLQEQTVLFWNHFCVDLASCFVLFCCLAEISWDWQWVSFRELSAFCCIDFCFSHLPLWAEGVASLQCDAATSSLHGRDGVFPHLQCLTFTLHSITNLFFPLNTEWPYWTCRITSPNFKLFNNLVSTCTYATLCDLFKKEWITHFDLS